jgi:hypothetical protein
MAYRRPLPGKAVVIADIIWRRKLTDSVEKPPDVFWLAHHSSISEKVFNPSRTPL